MIRCEKLPEVNLALHYMSAVIDAIPRASPTAKPCVFTHICHHYSMLGRGRETLDANRKQIYPPIFDDISPEQNHMLDRALNSQSDHASYRRT